MGLFDRFRRAPHTCDDPLFGALVHDGRSSWQGRTFFGPAGTTVPVTIVSGDVAPGERERARFSDLEGRYASFLPDIAQALFDLYVPARDAAVDGLPEPASAREMVRLVRLDWIELVAGGGVRLGYGFVDGVGWDDAMFTIAIVDGRVRGESLDD